MGSEAARLDVLTMGRVGVDIYPLQAGVSLEDVTTFGKYLGGSATNVAVAAARLGRSAAVITRTGNDPFGRFVHHALKGYGVSDQFVTGVPGLPTPVTFCEIFPPDDFPIYFYRYPKAPDLEIRAEELDYDAIRAARVFWVTATGLSAEPSRSATLAALEARGPAAPANTVPSPCSTSTTGPCSGPRGKRPARPSARRSPWSPSPSATSTSATWRSARAIHGLPGGRCSTGARTWPW